MSTINETYKGFEIVQYNPSKIRVYVERPRSIDGRFQYPAEFDFETLHDARTFVDRIAERSGR